MLELITQFFSQVLAIFHDLPTHLALWTASMGPWIYVAMFAIIFAETGLIVTPFLPGDSLLFALGALTAVPAASGQGTALDFWLLAVLLIIAANLGDIVNYSVGRWLGLKLFRNPNSKIFNPAHLRKTQGFYEKHGGKTIIIARFMPIVRTYAPFVAGVGRMRLARYATFCVSGGALWIFLFLSAGHFFGNIPEVRARFQYVVLAIIAISVLPAVVEILRARSQARSQNGDVVVKAKVQNQESP